MHYSLFRILIAVLLEHVPAVFEVRGDLVFDLCGGNNAEVQRCDTVHPAGDDGEHRRAFLVNGKHRERVELRPLLIDLD